MGWPSRFSFRALAPSGPRKNRYRVTDAVFEIAAEVFNAVFWQVAGLNKTGPQVSLSVNAGGVKISGGEAWNTADGTPLRVVVTHPGTGQFTIAAPATAPDENGVAQPIVFLGAQVTARSAILVSATYTLDSPTQITVYLFDDNGDPIDCAFTVDIK